MRILIAEDVRLARLKLSHQLERMGHEVVEAADGEEAWRLFQHEAFPMVITDWEMPKLSGLELIERIRNHETSCYAYTVLLTGKSDKEHLVSGLDAGADDFIVKPFDDEVLRARLAAGQRIVELEHRLADANDRLRQQLAVARELAEAEYRRHEDTLWGESLPVRILRAGVKRLARNDLPLRLTGPLGAGQEAVARAIHRESDRCDGPFIYLDCTQLSAGHEGDFQWGPEASSTVSPSKTRLADGGTLYLERCEALSPTLQQRLVAFLRDGIDARAQGRPTQPDVRVIVYLSAESLTDSDALAPELLKLLDVNLLAVPSLEERRDDIVVLANRMIEQRARATGKVLEPLSRDSEGLLRMYAWPGNIRELRSVMERAVMLAAGKRVEVPIELLQEGRRVGGYMLQRKIGAGGMGEVWLAQHSLLARPAAVKLIRNEAERDAASNTRLRERFQREADATSRLRSPHTVELYDFGVTEDRDFFYVMEFLQGIDFQGLVHEFGPLEPARAAFMLQQACMSLAEAHEAGMVHRDVKPANLFLCRLGTHFDFVKLLDFGIVRATQALDVSVTSVGAIRGTPECISPEASRGQTATASSDIYGLGCVAYWLLTGQRVFNAANVAALLVQHATKEPRPPIQLNPDLPSDLNQLILRCLAKDPSHRPTAMELENALATMPLGERWSNSQAREWWLENQKRLGSRNVERESGLTIAGGETRPDSAEHVSDAELRQWLQGGLPVNREAAVEQHVEGCEACAVRVGEVEPSAAGDPFVERVKDALDGGTVDGDETLRDDKTSPGDEGLET